jgi:hypothetical protein
VNRRPSPAERIAYAGLAGSLCLAAVVAIVILVSKESSDFAEDLALTAVALLVNGLAIAAGIAVLDRPRLRWLGLVCVAVGAVGFAVSASLGWSTASDDAPADWLLRAAGSLTVWSLALAQVAILLSRRDPAGRKLVDRSIGTAVAGALALAALLTVAIVDNITDEDFYRWVGVTAVVWVLGIALVPIARKLQREPR